MKSRIALAVVAVISSTNAFAMRGEHGGRGFDRPSTTKYEPEIVKWTGEIKDDSSTHTTRHDHDLAFTKSDDGKSYDVVDSPDLVKLHHESEKNYLVEIEAEKTPRFLFWGGNLIVRSFKVIKETSEAIPHVKYVARSHGRGR